MNCTMSQAPSIQVEPTTPKDVLFSEMYYFLRKWLASTTILTSIWRTCLDSSINSVGIYWSPTLCKKCESWGVGLPRANMLVAGSGLYNWDSTLHNFSCKIHNYMCTHLCWVQFCKTAQVLSHKMEVEWGERTIWVYTSSRQCLWGAAYWLAGGWRETLKQRQWHWKVVATSKGCGHIS